MKKKLIEVALPLDAINAASAYEKMPGIGAHPRGLHLWWARRPLTAARAVIWASLVDDPSSNKDKFPTEKEQNVERERLFKILRDLVQWKNSNNESVINAAKAEIMNSTGNNPPMLLDPFAGGGAIPLEAQRLGLNSFAHDLNPVAVMINKAMIEIPAKFMGKPPVNPDAKKLLDANYYGMQGMASDIAYYGKILEKKAFEKIGHLYPKVKVPETGQDATVVAWIWARTVISPNPLAQGAYVPLVSSFMLSKKKNHKVWVEIVEDENSQDGWRFEVKSGLISKEQETLKSLGTKAGKATDFLCCLTNSPIRREYIQEEGKAGRLSRRLMAIVATGSNGRIYLSPTIAHESIASDSNNFNVKWARDSFLNGSTPTRAMVTGGVCSAYGLNTWGELFTDRQLNALLTLSDLISDIRNIATNDAIDSKLFEDDKKSLSEGGNGSRAYGEAVGVYISLAIDRLADFSTSVSRWAVSNEKAMNLFNKQAIPMTWDYPEVNILGDSVGSISTIIEYLSGCIKTLPTVVADGISKQADAQSDCGLRNIMISTDPPYYDNISYADLSDFFYVWLRYALKDIFPDIFATMLTPKKNELVATPYRFSGSQQAAKIFFENGMANVCSQLYQYARDDIPLTIYYAFKQSDSDSEGTASTGWETMLNAIIQAGFSITGTWPMRTEQAYRSVAMGTNALASSIVLVCRKRESTAATCTRKNFLRELKSELETSLAHLQASNIAPVDMAQSAIGPGISVYSRYQAVLESDGSPMTVRSALKLINQALDDYFHGQGENLDAESRFAVDLYTQCGFNEIAFGEADVLARARNVAMNRLQDMGMVNAAKGKVRLTDRDELPEKLPSAEVTWNWVQILVRELGAHGIEGCAKLLIDYMGDGEGIKNLAYRLYQIADKKGWAQEGTGYNNLVISWQDIMTRREELKNIGAEAMTLNL